ncbi:hypothetical protein E4J42_23205 [Escherichia coli]|nr:hypothetical protein [Escherichia coli]EFB7658114.1 hypothetical protein [Escherichia coli]HAJ1787288.1 hypothetical protein [Escherichia coli]HAJ6344909.1 hypothetical protein [Escherichia coli]
MQESQENNSKPPAWRLFYLYLQLTLIYHSIHYRHRLRGTQSVSEASGLEYTPFCAHIEKNRP